MFCHPCMGDSPSLVFCHPYMGDTPSLVFVIHAWETTKFGISSSMQGGYDQFKLGVQIFLGDFDVGACIF